MRSAFLYGFLLMAPFVVFGQMARPESYQSDTAHINKCIQSASGILYIYPDSAFRISDTIHSYSERIGYNFGLYKAYNLKGILNWITNDLEQAETQYKLALKYANEEDEPRQKAIVLANLGLLFKSAYKMDTALHYLNLALAYTIDHQIDDLHTKVLFDLSQLSINQDNYADAAKYLMKVSERVKMGKDSVLQHFIYNTYGLLYFKVKNFDSSLNYYNKSIELDLRLKEIDNLSNTYNNIGELYFNTGNQFDSAVHYYKKAIVFALPHQKDQMSLASHVNQGNVFLKKQQLDSAFLYYQNAYNDPVIQYFPSYVTAVSVNLGLYYFYSKDYKKSRSFLESGYAMADSLGLILFKKNALETLISLDSATAHYKQALSNYREYMKLADSIHITNAKNEMAILEYEKYVSKQKLDNEVLVKENLLNYKLIANQQRLLWVTLVAIAMLLVGIYLLFRNRIKVKRLYDQIALKSDALTKVNLELTEINQTLNIQTAALKELNITKDKFFSILGHDLKSPFNSLLGMLQVMDEEWDVIADKEKKDFIHRFHVSSQKTYKLLDDLLSWGKAQQGLLDYKPETFTVNTKIAVAADLFKAQLDKKAQSLTINASDQIELTTDPRYFVHILQNLLNNAIKFTNHGGHISISAEIIDNKKVVCVVDNGIGIPESKVPIIFDLDADFNRVGTDNEKSTGMGLILCKEYANIIGGKLTVNSVEQDLEKGIVGESRFCLVLD